MISLVLLMLLQWETNAQVCADSGNLPQQQMNACAAWDFEQADAELNAVWLEVLAYVREADGHVADWDDRPSGEVMLREAQRAWIALRDAHCTLVGYEMRSGTAEPLLFNGCRAAMTRERIEQLRALIIE